MLQAHPGRSRKELGPTLLLATQREFQEMNSTQSQQPVTSLDPTGHHFPSPPMASEHKLAKEKSGDQEGILLNEATLGQEKRQT